MPEQIERKCVEYKNCSQKFTQKSADFSKQFCNIYLVRLRDMESLLVQRVQEKWGDKYPICQLHRLTEEGYEKCVVIGTLFKDQKLKPSVLKQLAEGNQLVPQPVLTQFTDESDVLFMEDEVQRYQLLGDIDPKKLVTGITCAILGNDMGKGKFQVDEFIFAGYRDQVERPILNEAVYVLFISGLDFIHSEKCLPNLQMLTYWLSGAFGDTNNASKICRVIIAGNSIRNEAPKKKACISMISRVAESPDSIQAVKEFDKFLVRLCQIVDVDLIPGEHDPSNHILPQQPLHFCMFPESSEYKSFNQVTNPYCCQLDNFKLLGSAGQPVCNIMKFSDITDSLEAMENCFTWNHLAPTAPDTLGCFPYYDKDPFIFEDCPHAYFAGNQPEFATKMVTGENGQKIRLISIPKFSETFQGVLLNLQNSDCEVISFETK